MNGKVKCLTPGASFLVGTPTQAHLWATNKPPTGSFSCSLSTLVTRSFISLWLEPKFLKKRGPGTWEMVMFWLYTAFTSLFDQKGAKHNVISSSSCSGTISDIVIFDAMIDELWTTFHVTLFIVIWLCVKSNIYCWNSIPVQNKYCE